MHDIGRTQLEAVYPGEGEAPAELMEFAELGEAELPLSEVMELDLTARFLEVGDEYELEQFLGGLMRTVGRSVGRFVDSGTGRALGGILKDAARKALPVVGSAIGRAIQPGRRGGLLGADIASKAGQLFGLELEGLSQEDREFEVARQFVRFATTATRQAIYTPASDPRIRAQSAAAAAARSYAPGLLSRLPGRSGSSWPRQGRWVRRGRAIVLYGG